MGNVLPTQKQIFHLHLHNFLGTTGAEFDYISFFIMILQEVYITQKLE